jgi:hypothetical protein
MYINSLFKLLNESKVEDLLKPITPDEEKSLPFDVNYELEKIMTKLDVVMESTGFEKIQQRFYIRYYRSGKDLTNCNYVLVSGLGRGQFELRLYKVNSEPRTVLYRIDKHTDTDKLSFDIISYVKRAYGLNESSIEHLFKPADPYNNKTDHIPIDASVAERMAIN